MIEFTHQPLLNVNIDNQNHMLASMDRQNLRQCKQEHYTASYFSCLVSDSKENQFSIFCSKGFSYVSKLYLSYEVTDSRVIRAGISVTDMYCHDLEVMSLNLIGSNLVCVVLLSQVVLERKIE